MIRAAIGRFVLHCIKKAKRRQFDVETRGLDFATLSDRQISDLLHGRPIDVSRPVFSAVAAYDVFKGRAPR